MLLTDLFPIVPAIAVVSAVMGACTDGVMNVGKEPHSGSDMETATVDTSAFSTDDSSSTDELSTDSDAICKEGVAYENLCWFVGNMGEGCVETCTEHGGDDETAASVIGSPEQRGTWTACRDIVRLLGISGEVAAGYRTDGAGLGCHIWDDGEIWWLYSPVYDPNATVANARRVCGCKGVTTDSGTDHP